MAEVLLKPGPSPVIRRSGIVPVFAVNTCCTVNGQNLRMSCSSCTKVEL